MKTAEKPTNINTKRLILKEVLCEMPFDTQELKNELYELGFPPDMMSRIWRGLAKDIRSDYAMIVVEFIKRKGNQYFMEKCTVNKWQAFEMKDLYNQEVLKSIIGGKLSK